MSNEYSEWNYEINGSYLSIADFFTDKRSIGVVSKNTAADMYGFSNLLLDEVNITIPKGYNNAIRAAYSFNSNVKSKYSFQLDKYMIEGKQVRIYSPERTIVELIKEGYTKITDVFIDTMKLFFNNFKYSVKRLYEAAEFFNATKEVKFIESLIRSV